MIPEVPASGSETDTFVQTLCAVSLQLEAADALLETRDSGRAGEALKRAMSLTESCLLSARRHGDDRTTGTPVLPATPSR